MSVNEETIRQSANQIWESEGRPEGHAERHWKQAVILAESENDTKGTDQKKSVDPSEKKGPTEPAQPDQT